MGERVQDTSMKCDRRPGRHSYHLIAKLQLMSVQGCDKVCIVMFCPCIRRVLIETVWLFMVPSIVDCMQSNDVEARLRDAMVAATHGNAVEEAVAMNVRVGFIDILCVV